MNSQTWKSSVQIKFLDNPLTLQKQNKLEQLQSTTLTKPVDMGHMWPNSGNDMG